MLGCLLFPSYSRKRVSSFSASYWIPASAGITENKILALWIKHHFLNLIAMTVYLQGCSRIAHATAPE